MLRIIREPDCYATVSSPGDIAQAIGHGRTGRYIVEEISPAGQLLPSGHSSRRWGTASRRPDG